MSQISEIETLLETRYSNDTKWYTAYHTIRVMYRDTPDVYLSKLKTLLNTILSSVMSEESVTEQFATLHFEEVDDSERVSIICEGIVKSQPHLAPFYSSLMKESEVCRYGLWGNVQQQKTNSALACIYMAMLHGKSTVYTTLNSCFQSFQVMKRCKEFAKFDKIVADSEEFNLIIQEYNPPPLDCVEISPSMFKKLQVKKYGEYTCDELNRLSLQELKALKFLDNNEPECGVVIVMMNKARVSLVNSLINCDFIFVADEGDDTMYQKSTDDRKYDLYSSEVYSKSFISILVSATQTRFWTDPSISVERILKVPLQDTYVGYSKFEVNDTILGKCATPVKMKDSIIDGIPAVVGLIVEIAKSEPYQIVNRRTNAKYTLPRITAVKLSDYIKHHCEIFEFIKSTGNSCIMWNGGDKLDGKAGLNIKLYSSGLNAPRIIIPVYGEKDEICPRIGDCYAFKRARIGDVVQFCKDNGGYKMHGNLFLVAGQYFNRGSSCCSNDYEWHLTDQIFYSSMASGTDTGVQSLRLCGDYMNDYGQFVPRLWTTGDTSVLLRKSIETEGQMADIGSTSDGDLFVHLENSIVLPGVLKCTKKAFRTSKGKYSKLPTKCFSMDAREQVNIEATFRDETLGSIHEDMYAVGANPGYKFRASARKERYKFSGKDVPGNVGEYELRVVISDGIDSDTLLRAVYDLTVECVVSHGTGRWVSRPVVVKYIFGNVDARFYDDNQIRGHLKRMYYDKSSIENVNENTLGLLMKKDDKNEIYLRVN